MCVGTIIRLNNPLRDYMKYINMLAFGSIAVLAMTACTEGLITDNVDAETIDYSADTTKPLAQPSAQLEALAGFSGTYVIVDVRRASDVAASGLPSDIAEENPIGKTISFTRTDIEMEGVTCDEWMIIPARVPVVYVSSDPNLIDLTLAPTDSPHTSGDQQDHEGYTVLCERQRVMQLHKVDDRVLVMPWANSTVNLILEKTLPKVKIKAYQAQLKSMKFYSGKLTGIFDGDTLRASRAWYKYRANLDDSQPIPVRPAITENLLDSLSILN